MMDNLQPTDAALDGLPAWYLRVTASIFCKTIAYLFSMSLATSTVPRQWKEARIRPLPIYSTSAKATRRLSSRLNYTHHVQVDGASSGLHIPESGISQPASHLDIFGSLCLPSQRLHISCYHLLTPHRYRLAANQPICRCHLLGLFQDI